MNDLIFKLAAVVAIAVYIKTLIPSPREREIEAPASNFFSRTADDITAGILDEPDATIGTAFFDFLHPPVRLATDAPAPITSNSLFTGSGLTRGHGRFR